MSSYFPTGTVISAFLLPVLFLAAIMSSNTELHEQLKGDFSSVDT